MGESASPYGVVWRVLSGHIGRRRTDHHPSEESVEEKKVKERDPHLQMNWLHSSFSPVFFAANDTARIQDDRRGREGTYTREEGRPRRESSLTKTLKGTKRHYTALNSKRRYEQKRSSTEESQFNSTADVGHGPGLSVLTNDMPP